MSITKFLFSGVFLMHIKAGQKLRGWNNVELCRRRWVGKMAKTKDYWGAIEYNAWSCLQILSFVTERKKSPSTITIRPGALLAHIFSIWDHEWCPLALIKVFTRKKSNLELFDYFRPHALFSTEGLDKKMDCWDSDKRIVRILGKQTKLTPSSYQIIPIDWQIV